MRTAILIGLLYVGDAIGAPHYIAESGFTNFIVFVFLAFAVMDFIDFSRPSRKG